MKNILLTTTALATLFAGVASASTAHKGHAAHKHVAHKEKAMTDSEGFSVSVGGILEGQSAARSQKSEYTSANSSGVYKRGITPGNESIGFNTNAQAYIKAANKTASGTKYGAQVAVATTTATQIQQGQTSFNRTFLYTESDIGRFEAGSNDSVASTMRTGADSIARATGGIDGDWANYVVLNTYAPTTYTSPALISSNFITAPVTALTLAGYNGGAVELPRNITYYTPEYNGFQAGLSYTPDNSNYGNTPATSTTVPNFQSAPTLTAKNVFSGGLSWKGEFDHKQALKVSAVGETSSTTKAPGDSNSYYDNQSAIFGAEYTYEDFSVAASYGNQGKSGLRKNTTGAEVKGGSFWTVGAAYVQDQIGGSVTYMSSELNTNAFSLVSLGLDYQVAPGLLPYFEVSYFTMKQKLNITGSNNQSSPYKNNGTAFILGTKLSF